MLRQFSFNTGGSGDANANHLTAVEFFDDFIQEQNSNNTGNFGFTFTGSAGGGIVATGSIVQPVANRIGITAVGTGTSSNATGLGCITGDLCSVYCGNGRVILQGAIKTPANLSDSTNEYVIEAGFASQITNARSSNAVAISYKRTGSTNWGAYTSNNGTATEVTTSDNTLAVVANTWYNYKIDMNAAGTQVDFYICTAPGSSYTLIGSSTTNLPDVSHATNFQTSIYRASSFALQRFVSLDWIKLDVTFASSR